jgi:WxL domain surface cell wall-binding
MQSSAMTARSTRDDRGRRLRRRLLGAGAAATLAVAMSGCAVFKSNSSSQLNTIGNVQITSVICASDTNSNDTGYVPADSSCQGGTHGGVTGDAANGNYQISIAYKVSSATTAPSSFTSTNTSSPPTTPCGGGVTFNQNAGLASAFQSLSPAGSGKKWVAYYSTTQTYGTSTCQYLTVAPQFALNQAFAVAAFQGPLTYRPVVGWRQVNDSVSGNSSSRTATCGTSISTQYSDGVDNDGNGSVDMVGICADDPSAATISGADLSQNTRDLGVLPTANGSAQAGGSGTVTFDLNYKGAALPSGQFNLTADSDIPGATETPSQASLVPQADSDNSVDVNVSVPATTTPGTYHVNITATLSTDPTQTRGLVSATLTVGENLGFGTVPTLPSLGSLQLNGQAQTKTAKMNNFSVIDSPGSSDVGWNVTVQGDSTAGKSAVFKQYCPPGSAPCGADPAGYVTGGRSLVANSLTLSTSGASWSGGTGGTPTFNCSSSACFVDAASAQKIAAAANSAGTGLWSASGFGNSSVSLATPTTLRVLPTNELYHADVVWTLNSGP